MKQIHVCAHEEGGGGDHDDDDDDDDDDDVDVDDDDDDDDDVDDDDVDDDVDVDVHWCTRPWRISLIEDSWGNRAYGRLGLGAPAQVQTLPFGGSSDP